MRLEGRIALVTGASSGIGRALSPLLAERGATLALAGRDTAALAEVAGRTGGEPLAADLAEPGGAELLADLVLERHGRVDLLVSNAGAGWAGDLAAMPLEVAERLVTLNLVAPVRLTRLLLPGMLERGSGHLVYVTSIAGATGVAREAVYAATKAGLATFADSVREEVAGSGVTVSVVVPGVVDTPFFERRGSAYDRAWPPPIPAERVARALLRAIAADRAEVFAPAWIRLPARLKGAVPGVYRRLALRFGQAGQAGR
ncbi:MAG TPA: SDR family NAD(P)-dependent oxidoreductase [Actinomycetes bacterium]|jgi:short-subunit dehydrogenase|nr:SDR family NAD(P)-dependent oxidoreductase [Actinomycetes bacterium]